MESCVNKDIAASNINLSIDIENIEVKGQYISLAAPIHLSGQLNITKLLIDYPFNINASSEHLLLQIGVDEAGRGPLLGSVNVAAAILPKMWSGLIEDKPLQDTELSLLTDSKQLSEKKRDTLYPLVQQYALGYIIAEIPAAVIDQVNILQATMLGMRLCTEELLVAIVSHINAIADNSSYGRKSDILFAELLFDGNRCPELDYAKLAKIGIAASAIDCQAWVKGDARHTSIAAASILAKVSRDQTMYQLHTQHPEYGIAQHKGYPTKAHMQAINDYGVLPEHRRSFSPVRQALENK
ncbi:ribonuclease HII [Psychrobacter frigidicola]|uniref:Ribonuclease n=1 Tax=Psychrobacter frigidicola TaxID=45611 RepID=A0A5C7A7J3_9GAMM|nr:ribonuclease HII [Psychrobacter frigidicola]